MDVIGGFAGRKKPQKPNIIKKPISCFSLHSRGWLFSAWRDWKKACGWATNAAALGGSFSGLGSAPKAQSGYNYSPPLIANPPLLQRLFDQHFRIGRLRSYPEFAAGGFWLRWLSRDGRKDPTALPEALESHGGRSLCRRFDRSGARLPLSAGPPTQLAPPGPDQTRARSGMNLEIFLKAG